MDEGIQGIAINVVVLCVCVSLHVVKNDICWSSDTSGVCFVATVVCLHVVFSLFVCLWLSKQIAVCMPLYSSLILEFVSSCRKYN